MIIMFFYRYSVFFCFPLELFLATAPVQSAPPPERLPPPEPEPKSPPKKSFPPPPLLPPLRQWLSHEDMHLMRKEVTYLWKPEEC